MGISCGCLSQEFDAAGRELWLKGRPAARFTLLSAGRSIPLKTWRNPWNADNSLVCSQLRSKLRVTAEKIKKS
jgi:hypothetical protein